MNRNSRIGSIGSNHLGLSGGLKYQSAFPTHPGKLAMKLFLSTEAMLFAALIGSYIVLRFSAGGVWPDQSEVQVDVLPGIINTIVLMMSSLTIVAAVRASAADKSSKARFWLIATLLLGTGFLAIKGYEYSVKYKHGIYPIPTRSLMYDQANDDYLSRTVFEMRAAIRRTEKLVAENPGESARKRLEKLYLLQSGIVDWTQFKVGRTGDSLMKRRAIETMAHQIDPISDDPGFGKYLADETTETRSRRQTVTQQWDDADRLLKQSQAELEALLPGNGSDNASDRERFERESTKTARLTATISELRNELGPLESRLQAIDQFADTAGFNQQLQLKLPIVIPGGNRWASVYYLLTGIHALHVLCGLVVMAALVPPQFGAGRAVFLENFSLYWLFVDLVWLVLFVIVYLL